LTAVGFLAQQMAQTLVARLLRIAWRSVGNPRARGWWPTSSTTAGWGRIFIGVDEVPRGITNEFLACVADHVKPRIV